MTKFCHHKLRANNVNSHKETISSQNTTTIKGYQKHSFTKYLREFAPLIWVNILITCMLKTAYIAHTVLVLAIRHIPRQQGSLLHQGLCWGSGMSYPINAYLVPWNWNTRHHIYKFHKGNQIILLIVLSIFLKDWNATMLYLNVL